MRYRGPVVTLAAVAALAGVLFLVNMQTVADTAARGGAPPAAASSGNTQPGNGQAPTGAGPSPSPGPPPGSGPVSYAGRTSGDEATIAIAVDGDAASAYVCDGARVESWLDGTMNNGRLTLQGRNGDKVAGVVQDGDVFGTIRVRGTQWPYSARTADAPAGLYEGQGTVDGAPARVGWIVLQDGSQVGVADVGGAPRPAPALDPRHPGAVEVGGTVIVPRPIGGNDVVVPPPS